MSQTECLQLEQEIISKLEVGNYENTYWFHKYGKIFYITKYNEGTEYSLELNGSFSEPSLLLIPHTQVNKLGKVETMQDLINKIDMAANG